MATNLYHRLQATAFAAMACILFSPLASRSEVTYRLVTSDDQILDRCVYIMAADLPDNSTHAVGKFEVNKNYKIGTIPTIPVEITEDQLSPVDGMEMFLFKYLKGKNINDANFKNSPWVISSLTATEASDYTYYKSESSLYLYFYQRDSKDLYTNNQISINSDYTASIVTYNSNKEWGFKFNNGKYYLNALDIQSGEGIHPKLYRKDIYDLHIIQIKQLESGEFSIMVHVNKYEADNDYSKGELYYTFSDEELLTSNNIYSLSSSVGSRHPNYNDGDLEIKAPANKKYLWLVRDHGSNYNENDAIRIEIKETPAQLPVTSIEAGHFAVPKTEGYSAGQQIEFERQNDVKIYYTLDGNDPVIPSANSMQALDESEDHSGKTYDLDERPLTYDGSPLSVRFVAIKSGHAPSEVHSFSVAGTTTSLETIERDDDSQAEYFTLQGIRLTAAPSAPGIYLRKSASGKVQKIIIR